VFARLALYLMAHASNQACCNGKAPIAKVGNKMTFEDIELIGIDFDNVKDAGTNRVFIPYILSAEPPREWKDFFLRTIRGTPFTAGGPVKIITDLDMSSTNVEGNKVIFECTQDKNRIKEGGNCWEAVAEHVSAANKWYHDLERASRNQRQKEGIARKEEEQRRNEIEKFKRDLKED